MPGKRVTLGEVFRGVQDVRGELKAIGAKVEERPDWQDVRRIENALIEKVTAEREQRAEAVATASRAIKALEDWNKWALRTAGAALIGAGVLWVINGGLIV